MPEVIFEPNSDIYTVDWAKTGGGLYYAHLNYDGDGKYIYTTHQSAQWRDIRFGIDMAGFDGTDKSINFIQVHFRCKGLSGTQVKAIVRTAYWGEPPWYTTYGSSLNLTLDYVDYNEIWTLSPITSNPWEWIDIAQVQIGISGYPVPYFNEEEQIWTWEGPLCSRMKLLVNYNDWLTPPPELSGFLF